MTRKKTVREETVKVFYNATSLKGAVNGAKHFASLFAPAGYKQVEFHIQSTEESPFSVTLVFTREVHK